MTRVGVLACVYVHHCVSLRMCMHALHVRHAHHVKLVFVQMGAAINLHTCVCVWGGGEGGQLTLPVYAHTSALAFVPAHTLSLRSLLSLYTQRLLSLYTQRMRALFCPCTHCLCALILSLYAQTSVPVHSSKCTYALCAHTRHHLSCSQAQGRGWGAFSSACLPLHMCLLAVCLCPSAGFRGPPLQHLLGLRKTIGLTQLAHPHAHANACTHTHTWVRDMLLQPWDGCPCSCSRSCSCSCSCLCSCSCSCSWSMAMHWPADPCTLCLGLNHAWADALACCTGNRGYHHLLSPEDEALLPLLRDFQRIIAYRCAPACKVCLGLCNPQHSITFLKPAHGGGAACLSFGAVGVRLKCRALVRLECGSNIGLKTGWRWRVLGDWWDVGGPGGMFPEAQLGCTCSSTVLCECQHAVMCKCQHAVTCECLGHVQVLACSHAHVRCLPPGTCTPFS